MDYTLYWFTMSVVLMLIQRSNGRAARRSVFLMAILLYCSLGVRAQKKDYEISVAGIEIGSLTITRESKGELTNYDLKSKVKLWLFFRIEAEYNMTAVYRGDQLISSRSQTHTNKGDFKSSTEWDGHQYRVNIDAYEYKKDTLIAEPIHFNVGRMYFEKPVQGQKIYADNFGLLIPAVKSGSDGIIVRILGNASTYHFRGNVMFDASMYHPLKNYRVKIVSGEQ